MSEDDDVREKRLGEERVTGGQRCEWRLEREALLHSRDQGPSDKATATLSDMVTPHLSDLVTELENLGAD